MKKKIVAPYIGSETIDGIPILFTNEGDYSVIFNIDNPILIYSSDMDFYEDFHLLFSNVLKILGENYIIQKQDIFSKERYKSNIKKSDDYLHQRYFEHFDGRSYTKLSTYLIVTYQVKKGKLFSFNKDAFQNFKVNINKIVQLLENKKIRVNFLSEKEINTYIKRFFSFNFSSKKFGLDNFSVENDYFKIGEKYIKSLSLVDIDEVNFPSSIKSYKNIKVGVGFPADLMNFIFSLDDSETVVYNQTILIPNQRQEIKKLEAKQKRHRSMPDPANDICVEDIDRVMTDIAKDDQLLVYCNFNFIIHTKNEENLGRTVNKIETELFDIGIVPSRQTYNQLELFQCCLPGNASKMAHYDKFLTTSDSALCLLFKERSEVSEITNYTTYFTDRNGIPVAMDISGKEGEQRFTDNANRFVLGPSGSGKSFFMNALIRQSFLQNTDIVLVDTGHSYSGLCSYYNGRYITYSEEEPISMNPFKIKREEYNEEKRDFLKSMISLIWKGGESGEGKISKVEDTLLNLLISDYYNSYFEQKTVKELSFNSFYEFLQKNIEKITKERKISFDSGDFFFVLSSFYKGGQYEKMLNSDLDRTLFDEKFIVFEIDNIKNNKTLFPIVTLIIMDVFIQKMRLKPNRKSLIIEEAWKAIANPMMAEYIQFLYKTCRKFWGETTVVTQELGDIIGNDIVKDSIIGNSDTYCLLDQAKFKDNYDEIAQLLSINEVERKKIFTINNLYNKDNRPYFREIYIKRGWFGNVYGVEVSQHEYFTFTTERIEKEAVQHYVNIYGDFNNGLDNFILHLNASKLKKDKFCYLINKKCSKENREDLVNLSQKNKLLDFVIN